MLLMLIFSAPQSSLAQNQENIPVIIEFAKYEPNNAHPSTRSEMRKKQILELKNHASATQAAVIKLLKERSIKKIRPLWISNSIATSVPPSLLEEIKKHPLVEKITLDRIISLDEPQPVLGRVPGWNIEAINAPELWAKGHTGIGAVVAVLDSGADLRHPAINNQFRGGANSWFDPSGEHPNFPVDTDGHGTGVISLAVGGTSLIDGIATAVGVAPSATWIAAKIFDNNNEAPLSRVKEALQWILDPDGNPSTDDAPDVVNNSWSFSTAVDKCLDDLASEISAVKAADIVVIVSAGNDGPQSKSSSSPGNNPDAYSIGSIGQDLGVSSFSSRGPSSCDGTIYPNFVAPGNGNL